VQQEMVLGRQCYILKGKWAVGRSDSVYQAAIELPAWHSVIDGQRLKN